MADWGRAQTVGAPSLRPGGVASENPATAACTAQAPRTQIRVCAHTMQKASEGDGQPGQGGARRLALN